MTNLKFSLLGLCITFISLNALCQKKSDVSLIFNSNKLLQFNLEYRTEIKEGLKLKIGYSQGYNNYSSFYGRGTILSVTDTLIVHRNRTIEDLQFTLFTGIEKRLKQSIFSVSGDVLLSYKRTENGYYSQRTELQDNGEWYIITPLNGADYQKTALKKTNYLNPGFQFKFSMDIPIEKLFFLHLFIGQTFSLPIYMGERVYADPLNEFQSQKGFFTFQTTSQAGIGLRYRFN